ncbi:hypothetical protein J1605_022486 [Eschrichtius robustus]|uniref:Cleavage and polyadenylation specificity factor subunit 4 n=1 Tax=Eschrichtius robustus TaxID=9764 RepID=A0AB34HAV8_ESCRO|nr:hypothetical protein J1605_022486 [Eschrichtius robustus]
MLRSTGFFRTIDCPYWAGAPGGPCRRPYCHFRHRGARGPGAPGEGGAAPPAAGNVYAPAPGCVPWRGPGPQRPGFHGFLIPAQPSPCMVAGFVPPSRDHPPRGPVPVAGPL